MAHGAIHSQRAHVDGLARLIDRLLRAEQDGCLVFQLNRLRIFRGAYRRVHSKAQLIVASEPGGKTEARFHRAAAVERAGEERPRIVVWRHQIDTHRARLRYVAVGFRDDDADSSLATGDVLFVAKHVYNGPPDDLRNGFDAFNGGAFVVVVLEAITNALPQNIFERDGLFGNNRLLPLAFALTYRNAALNTAQRMILRVENLDGQRARSLMR